MKKSELRQLIREEISKVLNEEDSINDVIHRLNNLPFTGEAKQIENEIHYYLDDNDVHREAFQVKKLARSLGWKIKKDNDDILIFKKQ
jgi:hypothetical protein